MTKKLFPAARALPGVTGVLDCAVKDSHYELNGAICVPLTDNSILGAMARTHEFGHSIGIAAVRADKSGGWRVSYPAPVADLTDDFFSEAVAAAVGLRPASAVKAAVAGFRRFCPSKPNSVEADYRDFKIALAKTAAGLRAGKFRHEATNCFKIAGYAIEDWKTGEAPSGHRAKVEKIVADALGLKPLLVTPPPPSNSCRRGEAGAGEIETLEEIPFIAGPPTGAKNTRRWKSRRGCGPVFSGNFVRGLLQNSPADIWGGPAKLRLRGGVILIDGSSSMNCVLNRIPDLVAALPAATVYAYGGAGEATNGIWNGYLVTLAKNGKVHLPYAESVEKLAWVKKALRRRGNSVDALAISTIMGRHCGEKIALLTDGAFCGGVDGQDHAAQLLSQKLNYCGDDCTAAMAALA